MCFHVTQHLEKMGRTVKALIFLDSRRFIQPDLLSEEEITKVTDEYLADPRAQEYLTSPVLREAMRQRIAASLRFIHHLQDDGLIHADIHFITSETYAHIPERTENWSTATTGSLHVYTGFGPHAEMISAAYMQSNAQVYKDILAKL